MNTKFVEFRTKQFGGRRETVTVDVSNIAVVFSEDGCCVRSVHDCNLVWDISREEYDGLMNRIKDMR